MPENSFFICLLSFVILPFCTLPHSTLGVSGTFPHREGNEGRCNLPIIPVDRDCQTSRFAQCVERKRGDIFPSALCPFNRSTIQPFNRSTISHSLNQPNSSFSGRAGVGFPADCQMAAESSISGSVNGPAIAGQVPDSRFLIPFLPFPIQAHHRQEKQVSYFKETIVTPVSPSPQRPRR